MLYGYLAAVIAGFVLTAVPNWTGRLPVMGWRLAALFSLWLAGRGALLLAPGAYSAAIIDAAFLIVMDIIVWREVLTGKNWRNVPVCVLLGMLAIGNVFWHVDILSGGSGNFGLRWGLSVVAILLALIGGRVTPSFTRNWLAKTNRKTIEATVTTLDKAAIAAALLSMSAWLFAPAHSGAGALLIGAGLIHLIRLARWAGWRTFSEPLVTILHIGYLWLALALLLLGVSAINPLLVSQSTALHALTAGAAGVMTLAVMTRATRGHTARALSADHATVIIYMLVNLGAAIRLIAPYFPQYYAYLIMAAGAVWGLAFLTFAIVYGRYLVSPRAVENV